MASEEDTLETFPGFEELPDSNFFIAHTVTDADDVTKTQSGLCYTFDVRGRMFAFAEANQDPGCTTEKPYSNSDGFLLGPVASISSGYEMRDKYQGDNMRCRKWAVVNVYFTEKNSDPVGPYYFFANSFFGEGDIFDYHSDGIRINAMFEMNPAQKKLAAQKKAGSICLFLVSVLYQ
jgi:hypothetical protein